MKFAVHTAPRAQSFWASQVLSTFDSVCLHEPFAKGSTRFFDFRDTSNLIELIPGKNVGFSEVLRTTESFPGYREAVIMRERQDILDSFDRMGIHGGEDFVDLSLSLLEKKSKQAGVLTLSFPVVKENSVIKLFQHCLGRKPTGSELRKARAKIYVPKWYVEEVMLEVTSCR